MSRAVLVTDGEQRASLAIVRSLGRAGYRVHVCSTRNRSLAGASRHCRNEARVSDPLNDPAGFVTDVRTLVDAWAVNALIPVTDASLLAILPARDRFDGICIPFPDSATFRRAFDKRAMLEAAPRFGIGVPEQCVLPSREALADIPADVLAFPLAIKPSRSIGEGGIKTEIRYAENRSQLEARLAEIDAAAYPLLLQRRVRGPGIGVFLLLWNGETVAVFSHRRIREKPPSGGVSVYRESIPADRSLVARSRALLEHVGWQGVAMVEYKVDDARGVPYLMEINGRFWGSLQLAIDAGVDFPALLLSAAAGQRPAPVLHYRTGIRSRWWWGDVDHLLARLRASWDGYGAPAQTRSKWQAIRDFFTLWRPNDRNEVLRRDDPRPFLRETVEWLRGR